MDRIVLDTNSLIQCLPSRRRYHVVWNDFVEGRLQLCVSTEILDEYAEIIERFYGVDVSNYVLNIIANNRNTVMVSPAFRFLLIEQDPDDNKFVDCAVTANARCIVTNDRHYNVLNRIDFPKVLVEKLDVYISNSKKQNS